MWRPLGLACALGLSLGLPCRAADFWSAGPLFDEFRLTLSPGTRTEALGPLYYEQHCETETTWAIPPLFSDTKDPGVELHEVDALYPVITYDRYGDQYRWQFLQVFSVAGGPSPDAAGKQRITLFPVYFQQRSSNPDDDYTAVFPFYGTLKHRFFRDEIFFAMFPLYSQTRKREVISDNYLYPFVNRERGPGLRGWQVWPLVGHEHKEVTTRTNGFNEVQTVAGHDGWFALWPIYFNDHTGLGTTNAGWDQSVLPLYSLERSPARDSTTVIWPFFSKVDDREKKYREWDAPWPLIVFARGEGKYTSRVWPFFSQAHSPTLEDDFYLWPVYKHYRAQLNPLDRERTRILFYLYSHTTDRNTETHEAETSSFLWPFFTRKRDFKGSTRLQVFAPIEPFVMGSHKVERDWSPLWSVWRAENNPRRGAASQSLLWNLYRKDVRPEYKKVSILLGLFQYQSGPENRSVRLFYIPVFTGKAKPEPFGRAGDSAPANSGAAGR